MGLNFGCKCSNFVSGSLSYAELGTLITKSGGEYPYMWAGLGRIVAYLYAWTKIVVLTPSSAAIITLTFAEYVVSFFDFCGAPQVPPKIIAAVAMSKLQKYLKKKKDLKIEHNIHNTYKQK